MLFRSRLAEHLCLALILAVMTGFVSCASSKGSAAASNNATTATITVLETSDIHGMIAPWDYATDKPFDGGLAKGATIIKQERAKDPDLILLDCGDTVQDNMIQEFRFEKVHPLINAMNSLHYDAWELGNHEFNFEFENLEKNIKTSKAPVLAANIYKKDGSRFVKPYIIKTVKGVKVAIIGLDAPHIINWEASNPEHFNNMTFTQPIDELGKLLPEVQSKADIILVLAHYGKDGEYDAAGMTKVAEKYGSQVAAFLVGHAHETYAKTLDNGTVMVEPGVHVSAIAKVTLNLKKENGKWVKDSVKPEILPVSKANVTADPDMLALTKDVDTKSKEIANTVVGKIGGDFLPSLWWNGLVGIPTATVQDTAMIDLINTVQMKATK